MVTTGASFADAAAGIASLRRARPRPQASTVDGYKAILRSQLLPAFGELPPRVPSPKRSARAATRRKAPPLRN